MGLDKIVELERLAESKDLLAPIPYENPNRNAETFYKFIEDYASLNGRPISVKEFTYHERLKHSVYKARGGIKERRLNAKFFLNCLDILLAPFKFIDVIALGSGMGDVDFDEETKNFIVRTPKYEGIFGLFGSTKVHEYKHIYHYLISNELKERGLITIDGYHDIFAEPNSMVPSYNNLKRFERKLLQRIIRKEKKHNAR
ncbi:MAG: hypothetical protein V1734_02865 [Nanoarchaeota archaeon]